MNIFVLAAEVARSRIIAGVFGYRVGESAARRNKSAKRVYRSRRALFSALPHERDRTDSVARDKPAVDKVAAVDKDYYVLKEFCERFQRLFFRFGQIPAAAIGQKVAAFAAYPADYENRFVVARCRGRNEFVGHKRVVLTWRERPAVAVVVRVSRDMVAVERRDRFVYARYFFEFVVELRDFAADYSARRSGTAFDVLELCATENRHSVRFFERQRAVVFKQYDAFGNY